MIKIIHPIAFIVLLAGAIVAIVLFVKRNRRERFEALPLDKQYPEILDWQVGDDFDTKKWIYHSMRLAALDADGWVYIATDDYTKRLTWFNIKELAGTNLSARNRKVERWIKSSQPYMETLDEIRNAKKILSARDKKRGITA